MKTNLTMEEIHKLHKEGRTIYLPHIKGRTKVVELFEKLSRGRKITFSDDTYLDCAITHYVMIQEDWRCVSELSVGDCIGYKSITCIDEISEKLYLDVEVDAPDSSYIQNGIVHHNSGKSVVIGLISDFLKSKGLKGLIVVPNISLVQQIFSDFGDYNLLDLQNNCHLIGGSNKIKHLESQVTISTRQSLALMDSKLFKEIDFVIVDECLHPDTLITTQRGQIKISNITLDDTVLTFNETNGAAEYKQIIKIHKNIGKEQMYQLNNTKITGNHKVLTVRGWKRVDELTTVDRILTNVE